MCVKDDVKIECYICIKQKYILKNYDNNFNYYILIRFFNIDFMIFKYYFRIYIYICVINYQMFEY